MIQMLYKLDQHPSCDKVKAYTGDVSGRRLEDWTSITNWTSIGVYHIYDGPIKYYCSRFLVYIWNV
jgi:hypothetical protein